MKAFFCKSMPVLALRNWRESLGVPPKRKPSCGCSSPRNKNIIKHIIHRHSIILDDGHLIGRIYIAREEEEIRLVDLTILPPYRNRGVGTTLLKQLQAEAESTAKALIHQNVNFNYGALPLYKRLGFEIVDAHRLHYLMAWLPTSLDALRLN